MTEDQSIERVKLRAIVGGCILTLPVIYDIYRGYPSFFSFILPTYVVYYLIKIPLVQSEWLLELRKKYEHDGNRKFSIILVILTLLIAFIAVLSGILFFVVATKILLPG